MKHAGSGKRWVDLLQRVEIGMKVIDRNGKEIGRVNAIFPSYVEDDPGGEDEIAPGMNQPGSYKDAFEDVFDPVDQLEEDARSGLRQSGFIRVDGEGLFGKDRYFRPENITAVRGDEVHVNIPHEKMEED